ncbi:hypothetical protein SDRG_07543 [Saprolegnia diclina VS20]|uniref:Uncharacterized protein n=1 Tax=Saprolegnia diclina (strain VS20) TaxID=1156394 RepID=T0Q9Y4_SAPDV|nr:hypothetical protein SDRG_07543 [Saprolegnia diclina VS20]EQC34729.1 hypothetical protein SDRG_07543 [Saprolegnia diclina VS20]|eukprot:XP_008611601.1 hypothetical protein SDRG_07543 [Saprolegnia diclina VS20]
MQLGAKGRTTKLPLLVLVCSVVIACCYYVASAFAAFSDRWARQSHHQLKQAVHRRESIEDALPQPTASFLHVHT